MTLQNHWLVCAIHTRDTHVCLSLVCWEGNKIIFGFRYLFKDIDIYFLFENFIPKDN